MITSVQESVAPPSVVLAALRDRVGEWRTPELPELLRRRGVLGITARIHGSACIVAYHWPGRGPDQPPLPLRLTAAVIDRGDGGSRVEIRCEYRSEMRMITLMSALVAIVPLLVLGGDAWPALLLAIGWWTFCMLLERDARRGPTRRADPEAAYLVERVEAIVVGVGSE